MGYKHGLRNKFYISADLHQDGAVTFTEVDLVEAVGNDDARDEAELVNRRGDTKKYGAGKRAVGYTLTVSWDPSDPACALLWSSYRANTLLGCADADGDVTVNGTNATFADMVVVQGPRAQDLAQYDSAEFVLKPAAESTYEPTWNTIGTTTTTP